MDVIKRKLKFRNKKEKTDSERNVNENEIRRPSRSIRYTTEEEVRSALVEFIIFVFFLILATVVCLSVRHTYMYYFNNTITKFFVDRTLPVSTGRLKFSGLLTADDYWEHIILGFLPTLHSGSIIRNGSNYNDTDEAINARKSKYRKYGKLRRRGKNVYLVDDSDDYNDNTDDDSVLLNRKKRQADENLMNQKDYSKSDGMFLMHNYLMGPPRIRQIRVKKNSCDVKNNLYIKYCYGAYKASREDKSPEHKTTYFHTLDELYAMSINANLAIYQGGGYKKDLTYSHAENKKILERFRKIDWIDRGTRLVVMEFNLFNENTDLFESVKLLCENLPTGSIIPSAHNRSIKRYSFFTEPNVLLIIVYILFYVMTLYYTLKAVNDIRFLGFRLYFSSVINIVEVIVFMMSWTALAYNVWHTWIIHKCMKHFKYKKDNYYSLDNIIFWNLIYIDMMGIMIFLIWIKIFRFIGFNRTLRLFTSTLSLCAMDLVGFGIMFGIVFLSYAMLGLIIFGSKHPDYVYFTTSVLSLTRFILTDFEYALIENANRFLGPIFFISYILLVYFILLNMFLAIIMQTYNMVKTEMGRDEGKLGWYLGKKIKSIYGYICRCGRPKQRTLRKRDDVLTTIKEQSMVRRRSQIIENKRNLFYHDLPDEVYNKDMTRLTNRIIVLEEILEQLVTNMDTITKKIEQRERLNRRSSREDSESSRRSSRLDHIESTKTVRIDQ